LIMISYVEIMTARIKNILNIQIFRLDVAQGSISTIRHLLYAKQICKST
jgi:hypothetical protein